MERIDSVAVPITPAGRVSARHASAGAGLFTLPALEPSEPVAVGTLACLSGLDGLLALQEAQTQAVSEREARRHGHAMLAALKRLQLALLTRNGVSQDDLRRLADLAASPAPGADPALVSLLGAIGLRARIELAKCPPPAPDAILSCVPSGAPSRTPL